MTTRARAEGIARHAREPDRIEKGRRAEERATSFLVDNGYAIVATNVRRARAEIDIVASDGDVLCFVEVRSRKSARLGSPAATITAAKQARIARAASAIVASLPEPKPRCRFDVVTLEGEVGQETIALIKGAFTVTS